MLEGVWATSRPTPGHPSSGHWSTLRHPCDGRVGRRRSGCSSPSPEQAQLQGAPASLGITSSSRCQGHSTQPTFRAAAWLQEEHGAPVVHPWDTHSTSVVLSPLHRDGLSSATPSQPAQTHPPAPYEPLHESKSALNQIIPNNNDINYAFNTFYCFPPFPSHHICVNNIQKIYGFLP